MMVMSPGMTLVGTTPPPWNMQYDGADMPALSDTGYITGKYASPGTNPFAALTAGGNINIPYTVNGSPTFSQPIQTSDWWSNLMLRMDPTTASNSSGKFDFQYGNATLFSEPVALKFHNQYYATDTSPWVQGLGILNPGSFGIDPGQVGPNDNSARRDYGWPDTMPLVVGIGGNTKTDTDTRAQEITPLGTAGSNPASHVDEGRLNVRVNSYSDWGVQAVYGDGNPDNPVDRKNSLTIDMLNGSPFTYFTKSSASADTNAFAKVWLRGNQVPGSAPALPVNVVWGRPTDPTAPGPDELPANVLALTLTTNNFDASGVLRTNTTSYLVVASGGAWSYRDEINTPPQPPQPQNGQLWVNPLANGTIVVVSLPHFVGQTKFEDLSDADKVAVAKQLFLPVAGNLPVSGPTATQVSDPKPHVRTHDNQPVTFGFDAGTGIINTLHTISIQGAKPTLQVLYPHQTANLFASDQTKFATFTPTSGPDAGRAVGLAYDTSLGRARLYAGNEFATKTRFQGTLNDLPNVAVQADRLAAQAIYAAVASFMTRYVPNPDFAIGIVENTYDRGLMTLSRMLQVTDSLASPTSLLTADQQTLAAAWRDRLLQDLRTQVLSWFDPATGRLFQLNKTYDTVIGYPAGYGSDTGVNDHHFHYGYFLSAFATIAQFNPAILKTMENQIRLLIRDVANFDRTDEQLPFLREFNPWAGHSWANGLGQGGNDQESASEAVNCYASIIRLGMLMNDQALVAQGVYLYQTEVDSMDQYWFNTSATPETGNFGNYSQDFAQYLSSGNPVNVTQIANVKQNDVKRELFYASDNYAEALYAINWVPTAAWTLFLGSNQDYLRRNWKQYLRDFATDGGRGVNQAVVAAYQAMMPDDGFGLDQPGATSALLRLDPDRNPSFAATNQIDPGFVGGYTGTNRAIALDWVYGMKRLGQVDATVVADTVSYGVFIKDGQRTFTAFNPSATPRTVTFRDATSDAVLLTLQVLPGETVTRLPDGRLLVDVSMQTKSNAGTSLYLTKPAGQDPNTPAGLTLTKQPGTALPIQVIAENPSQKLILDAYAATYTTVPKRPGDATNNGNSAPTDAAGIDTFTISGVNGVYRPDGQTGLEVFLNNALTWNEDPNPNPATKTYKNEYGPGVVYNDSFAASKAVIEVGYDFDGDGVYDRVETYTRGLSGVNRFELVGNLTPISGIVDPNVPDGRPALDPKMSTLAPFQDMKNGSVRLRMWQGTWAPDNNSHKEYAVSVNAQRGMSRSSRVVIPFDDADAGPQVLLVAPPPSPVTGRPVDSLTATLSQPAAAGAFTAASLVLTRDGQSVAVPGTVTVTRIGTTNDYTITGLAALTTQPGAYVLTVDGTKIQAAGSKPGVGSARATWRVDTTGPTLSLQFVAAPPKVGPLMVSAVFSEPVTGFGPSGVSVTGGTATNFRGAGQTYAFDVTPTKPGVTVSVAVAAGAAKDAAGNPSAAASLGRAWAGTGPSTTIGSTVGASTNLARIPVTVSFSAPVTGFAASSLVLGNATVDQFPTGSTGASYSFFLVPKGPGQVTLDVPAGAAKDGASQPSVSAATFSVISDTASPTGALTSIASYVTYVSVIPVMVLFSEPVTGFTAADLDTVNGSVANFRGAGARYAFDLVPDDLGVVSASIPAGVAKDAAGNANAAFPAFSRNFKLIPQATLTTTPVTPTSATSVPIQITFNQAMALDTSKIGVVNGTIEGGASTISTIDGAVYTFNVKPTSSPVTINLPALAAVNAVGAGNPSAPLIVDWGPTPTIKSFEAKQIGTSPSYTVTLVFDQVVNGLDASKLRIAGDTVNFDAWIGDVTGGGTTYNVMVTPRPKQGGFGNPSSPKIAIDAGSITGATGVPIGSGQSVQFDTIALTGPTMAMTSTVPTKTTQAPIPVAVRFSEPVKNFTAANLNTINGAISDFQQPDAGDASVYTFTLTPAALGTTAVVPDVTGVVSVTGDVPVMNANAFNRAIASPVVAGITSTAADGTYGVGDSIPIVVSFSGPVKVVGTPLLALDSRGATISAFATFDRISADGKSLTYLYKPAPGQMAARLDADSQMALQYFPNGANIFDASSNQPMPGDALLVPTGTAPGSLATARNIVIDTGRVTSILGVSSPKPAGLYATGETLPIEVKFSRPVVVKGTPELELNILPGGGSAAYVGGSGSDTLTFAISVAANQRSLHLDYASSDALDPTGKKWTIQDQSGKPISLTLPEPGSPGSLAFNAALGIAGVGPRVLALTSTAANNTTYGIGAKLEIRVGFDSAVAVTGSPTLRLNSGGKAVYAAGTGTSVLTFQYTVAAGEQTPALDAADTSALEGGTIRDLARNPEDRPSFPGNDADRTLPAPGAAGSLSNVSDNRNLRIAGVQPKVLAVFSPVNGLRTDGGAFDIDVKFDAQMAKPTGGTPSLRLSNGDVAEFKGIESDGKGAGNTLKFEYNPRNNAQVTKVAAGSAGQPASSAVINVDSTTGFPTSGRINVLVKSGQSLRSDILAYTGTTATSFTGCTLLFGAADDVIQAAGQVGNAVVDGRGLDVVSLDLNGAKLRDFGGNDAVLSLPTPGSAGSLSAANNIVLKTNPYTAPLVVDVSSSVPLLTTLGDKAQVPITITFSEPVSVAGKPELALSSGGIASYVKGSGGRVLSFLYTVSAGQNAPLLDYAAVSSLTTPGGNIRSIFGSFPIAVLDLPKPGSPGSLGFNERIGIDTATQIAPKVQHVTTLNPSGIYGANQTVLVQVVFDRAVTVTPAGDGKVPKLLLQAGDTVDASYSSGSGTNTLTFAFKIAPGVSAAALGYVTRKSLELDGATIRDRVSGKDAVTTLPIPGLAGSLRSTRLIVIRP